MLHGWVVAAGLCVAGAASALAQGVTPLDSAGFRKVEQTLGGSFGPYNARRGCWSVRARIQGNDASSCIKVVRAYQVATASGPQVFVLMNGKGQTDCHACSGIEAFAVLDAAGPAWRVLVRPVPELSGDYGGPVDAKNVVFTRFGADRWGWIKESGGGGMGLFGTLFEVRLLRGNTLVEAGRLPGGHDNSGACDISPAGVVTPTPGCERLETLKVSAAIDGGNPSASSYPIVLHVTGVVGRQRINRTERVAFDETRFRYPDIDLGLPLGPP